MISKLSSNKQNQLEFKFQSGAALPTSALPIFLMELVSPRMQGQPTNIVDFNN